MALLETNIGGKEIKKQVHIPRTYGKGSKRRPENGKRIRVNWDEIKGFGKSKYD